MTRIDAKYLTKVYKSGSYGLKNCSFSVNNGEFLVIVGASGEGKSTLLKVLAGTERLSSGELYFDGILSENIPMAKRDVSMAFQEYVLYPHMTVFDNLAAPLKQKGEDEKVIYDKVMDTLRLFNLDIAADVKPKHLSGGEQQRVALAKAMLKRSKLLLLDEPMSSVDEKSRWEYCNILKKMKQMLPDSTFVYVTHNTREALYLADRIAVMQDGRILQIAKKEFLIRHFEHLSSMEMLGAVDKTREIVYDGKPFDNISGRIDYSKIIEGQKIIVAKNALDEEATQIFDKAGRSLFFSSLELKLKGEMIGNTLSFGGGSVELGEEFISRLLYRTKDVTVGLSAEKFSKTPVSEDISLIFEVKENGGDFVILNTNGGCFILNKKTGLRPGEKIRLYYKVNDLTLYDDETKIICHYPLKRRVEVGIFDHRSGKIQLLGKRINLNRTIPSHAKYAIITEDAFKLSYDKGKCAIPVLDCLDEEFINGRKLNHIAIKGASGYLSVISDEETTCFSKNKLWLNVITDKITFSEDKT